MSLKSGVDNPRSPLRRFLDRELSAGAKPLRESVRSQHRADRVLMPLPGVGTEGGTAGTAVDTRLRLAFTTAAPVDLAAVIGIEQTGHDYQGAGLRMRAVGNEPAARLTHTVHALDLANRDTPIDRAHDEEEDLARLLIAAAWYQVLTRSSIGFEQKPPGLTACPHPARGLHARPHVPRHADHRRRRLRGRRTPHRLQERQAPAPLPQASAWQLLGYLLLDTADRYRMDTVGFYLSRSSVLASWPVEEYLVASNDSSGPRGTSLLAPISDLGGLL